MVAFSLARHFPTPQIMSFLLHELVALNLEIRYPDIWKKGVEKNEKDLVCLQNDDFSIEIKASSWTCNGAIY